MTDEPWKPLWEPPAGQVPYGGPEHVEDQSQQGLKFYEVLAASYDYDAQKAPLYVMAVSRESAETQVEWLIRRKALPITAIVGKEHALKFNPTTGEMLGSLDEA